MRTSSPVPPSTIAPPPSNLESTVIVSSPSPRSTNRPYPPANGQRTTIASGWQPLPACTAAVASETRTSGPSARRVTMLRSPAAAVKVKRPLGSKRESGGAGMMIMVTVAALAGAARTQAERASAAAHALVRMPVDMVTHRPNDSAMRELRVTARAVRTAR
jgi:hypothetical protein